MQYLLDETRWFTLLLSDVVVIVRGYLFIYFLRI